MELKAAAHQRVRAEVDPFARASQAGRLLKAVDDRNSQLLKARNGGRVPGFRATALGRTLLFFRQKAKKGQEP